MISPTCPYPPQLDSVGLLISMVRGELVRGLERALADLGLDLRYTQFLVIKRLAACGPMSATELARASELDGGAMTRLLDQLETKGYLRRRPHEQDRRALRIELTEAGEAIWTHMSSAHKAMLEDAQRELSDEERARLRDYLQRMLGVLRDKD
ncbi:MarR family winged helix-turn-helix transcriptional regulator [Pinirhizobacter sp.]|jgi:DNA-binding MarR family transcriptional regulator|uniref:MarR family winged helix-turn-helix transcriptional regulator n=1 Tax=Pinirhizobacter sp. TaxID=2950432 RepID=UPI002F41E5FA